MFWTLKSILVKINRTSQSDYFRDYCLVILIRGIEFSWTDFTVQQLFWFLVGKKDQSCRYINAKLKRTAKTKCCAKKQKEISVCSREEIICYLWNGRILEMFCVYQRHIKWPKPMWNFSVIMEWKPNQSEMPTRL